jgi:hypothetical protein
MTDPHRRTRQQGGQAVDGARFRATGRTRDDGTPISGVTIRATGALERAARHRTLRSPLSYQFIADGRQALLVKLPAPLTQRSHSGTVRIGTPRSISTTTQGRNGDYRSCMPISGARIRSRPGGPPELFVPTGRNRTGRDEVRRAALDAIRAAEDDRDTDEGREADTLSWLEAELAGVWTRNEGDKPGRANQGSGTTQGRPRGESTPDLTGAVLLSRFLGWWGFE